MYAIGLDVNASLRTNAALREYARNEYGSRNVEWFLATIRPRRRKTLRTPLVSHFRPVRAKPSHRPVGHKGTPRLAPSDLQPSD